MSWILSQFRKMNIKGFCRVMMISFTSVAIKILGGEKRDLTKEEYKESIIAAFSMRNGWLRDNNDVIRHSGTGKGINVDNKSFSDVVYEGMLVENIFSVRLETTQQVEIIIDDATDSAKMARDIITKIIGEEPKSLSGKNLMSIIYN